MKKMKLMMFILLAVLAGCKGKDDSLIRLRGHEWQLKSMVENGKVIDNPQELPTLIFTDSSAVYGSAGCNRFFGTYTVEDGGIMKFKTGGATMMYCPDMSFEDQYLKALNKVNNYVVTDKELKMKGANDNLVLVYVPVGSEKRIGVAKDKHGCNEAAGYTWSEVRGNCIRIFEEGIAMLAVTGQDTTLAAYVVFAADSTQAEAFIPNEKQHPVLKRRSLPEGGYAWNIEDDETYNLRQVDGQWVLEQRGQVLYRQTAD